MDGPYPEELLPCGGGGEGAGGAGAGDPQPAAAGGREGLLAGLPHPGHVRVASVVLQQQHLYCFYQEVQVVQISFCIFPSKMDCIRDNS